MNNRVKKGRKWWCNNDIIQLNQILNLQQLNYSICLTTTVMLVKEINQYQSWVSKPVPWFANTWSIMQIKPNSPSYVYNHRPNIYIIYTQYEHPHLSVLIHCYISTKQAILHSTISSKIIEIKSYTHWEIHAMWWFEHVLDLPCHGTGLSLDLEREVFNLESEDAGIWICLVNLRGNCTIASSDQWELLECPYWADDLTSWRLEKWMYH